MRLIALSMLALTVACASSPKAEPQPAPPAPPAPPAVEAEAGGLCIHPPLTQGECVERLRAAAHEVVHHDPLMDATWDGVFSGRDIGACRWLPETNDIDHLPTCPPRSARECVARLSAAFGAPASRDSGSDANGDGKLGGSDFARCTALRRAEEEDGREPIPGPVVDPEAARLELEQADTEEGTR